MNPLRLATTIGALCLLGSMASYGGLAQWHHMALTSSPTSQMMGGWMTPLCSTATGPDNVNYNLRIDSSLDANEWRVSTNPSIWQNVVSSQSTPPTGEFIGIRVGEPIDLRHGFWFGLSLSNEIQDLKHALRIRCGADGSSKPPGGTQIYSGYTRFDAAAGVTWAGHGIDPHAAQGPINVCNIGANTPPASAFPASLVNYCSWISAIQDDTASGSGVGCTAANATRQIVDLGNTPAWTLTEMVFVIFYPSTSSGTPSFAKGYGGTPALAQARASPSESASNRRLRRPDQRMP